MTRIASLQDEDRLTRMDARTRREKLRRRDVRRATHDD